MLILSRFVEERLTKDEGLMVVLAPSSAFQISSSVSVLCNFNELGKGVGVSVCCILYAFYFLDSHTCGLVFVINSG